MAENRHHMNVLVYRRLLEQRPGARDNNVLCVPLMGSKDRLTSMPIPLTLHERALRLFPDSPYGKEHAS